MSVITTAADELVILLMAEPGAWAKLRDGHQDDGRGHCRVCTVGCRQGYQIWPCTIAAAVQRAAVVRDAAVRAHGHQVRSHGGTGAAP